MPFCTFVEFEWTDTFDRARFADLVAGAGSDEAAADGRLSRIVGVDDRAARVIEVWRSSDDARAFAAKSRPALAAAAWPAPSRVAGFETTSYVVT